MWRPRKKLTPEDNEEEDDDNFFGLNGNNNGEFNEEIVNNEDEIVPEKELMLEFREYYDEAQRFSSFTDEEVDAIRCLLALRRTKAPMSTYESIMEWHLGCKPSESPKYVSRDTLFKKLKRRYHIEVDFYR